jgi:uncharacterized membrane protein (UPF0127 family)
MSRPDDAPLVPAAVVRFGDVAFRVALAATADEQHRGLMHRDSLGDVDGMLFVFERARRYAFWMQGVRIPLDIAWLDDELRCVGLVPNAAPCAAPPCPTYGPPRAARYVLEVPGGTLTAREVRVGAQASVEWG